MFFSQNDITNVHKYTLERLRVLYTRSKKELTLFTSVLDSMSLLFFVLDKKGQTYYLNKNALVVLKKNGIKHREVSKIFEGQYLGKRINEAITKSIELQEEIIETNIFKGISHIFCTVSPLVINKIIDGWIIMIQDYTHFYNLQKQIRRSDYLNTITHISSSIAHELKNPLGAISIHLQLLRKYLKDFNTNQKEELEQVNKTHNKLFHNLDIIEEEIDNMNNIIGLFLNNLNISSTELLEYNLNDLIRSFKLFIEPDLIEKKIICTIRLDNDIPKVFISRSSITHVLLNLVKNSMEALQEGGEIIISTYAKESNVFISVSDNGPGIRKEIAEKIYDPYFTTKEKGTGIGLAVSEKIMFLHNGSIYLDTTYKNGASFILQFPRIATLQNLLVRPEEKEAFMDDNQFFNNEGARHEL